MRLRALILANVIFLSSISFCFSQYVYEWQLGSETLGLPTFSDIKGICIDKEGNIYLTGSFENALTMSDDISLTSNGGSDAFVAKLDQTGEVLWAEKLGGDSDDDANSVTVDEAGNTYFTGTFEDEAVFGTPSAARVPIVEISELRAVVVEEEADTSENQENEDAPADSNPEVTSISLDGNSQENIFVAGLHLIGFV